VAHVQGVLDQVRVCILIPVYNECKEIGRLVESLKRKNFDVVVVDDGSTDDSGKAAQEKGAIVIRHDQKQGKGRSLQDGFESILKENKYDGVITIDGDGQHDIEDIEQFLVKAREYPGSIITGTRMTNPQGMPLVRLLTNRLMSGVISFLCRQKIPDTQCGFRFISASVLKQLKLTSSDFQIETEVLIKASKKGFKIYSVPIKTIYRGEASKINPIVDTFRFLVYIIKEMYGRPPLE